MILQILSIFLGGGAVQLIVAIFRRRSELREIDARASNLEDDISGKLTKRLAEELERQAGREVAMEDRIDELRNATDASRTALVTLQIEKDRLDREVAQLKQELVICRREVGDLQARIDDTLPPPAGRRRA